MPDNIKTIQTVEGPVDVERMYKGTYRVRAKRSKIFSQIKHLPSGNWAAEYRDSVSGAVLRLAGIWPNQRDAIEETAESVARGSLS